MGSPGQKSRRSAVVEARVVHHGRDVDDGAEYDNLGQTNQRDHPRRDGGSSLAERSDRSGVGVGGAFANNKNRSPRRHKQAFLGTGMGVSYTGMRIWGSPILAIFGVVLPSTHRNYAWCL